MMNNHARAQPPMSLCCLHPILSHSHHPSFSSPEVAPACPPPSSSSSSPPPPPPQLPLCLTPPSSNPSAEYMPSTTNPPPTSTLLLVVPPITSRASLCGLAHMHRMMRSHPTHMPLSLLLSPTGFLCFGALFLFFCSISPPVPLSLSFLFCSRCRRAFLLISFFRPPRAPAPPPPRGGARRACSPFPLFKSVRPSSQYRLPPPLSTVCRSHLKPTSPPRTHFFPITYTHSPCARSLSPQKKHKPASVPQKSAGARSINNTLNNTPTY